MVGLSGQVKTILLELGLSLKLETVLLNVNETSAEVKLTVSTFAPGHSQSRTGWRWTRWRRRRWPSLPSSWSASAPASACSGTMGKKSTRYLFHYHTNYYRSNKKNQPYYRVFFHAGEKLLLF